MKISSSRKAELVELAEILIEDMDSSSYIDLHSILTDNGIECNYDHFDDEFDALIVADRSRFVIHVNLRRCVSIESPRSRFSIAHELGHFFIEEHRHALLQGTIHGSVAGLFDSNESKEESEADFFAANLLMPPKLFLGRVDSGLSPVLAIKKLQKQFRTSLTATALQFLKLSASSCMIIKWSANCRQQWVFVGDKFKQDGYRVTTLVDLDRCIKGSASHLLLSEQSEFEYEESITTASSIFEKVAAGGDRDLVIKEEAQKLGQYGFLTFFSVINL